MRRITSVSSAAAPACSPTGGCGNLRMWTRPTRTTRPLEQYPMSSSSIRQLANSLTVLGVACASCASAATETLPVVWATVYDFLVQDVCPDAAGQAVMGLSTPAAECKRRKDMLPAGVLPYHKADWPGDEDRQPAPAGNERSESLTARHPGLGAFVMPNFVC